MLPNGGHVWYFWYKADDGLWWLGKISASTTTKGACLVRGALFGRPGPITLPLTPARYATSTGAVRGSWCLQLRLASAFSRGVQRNLDGSRGTAFGQLIFAPPLRPIVFCFSEFRGLDFSYRLVLACFESLGLGWGAPLRFLPPIPQLSAGAGLGNMAILLWRTLFLSFWGWILR